MALLHVLALLRSKIGFELTAHAVVHGLRPEAENEAQLAQKWAQSQGLDFGITRLQVSAGSNLQARARAARFDSLRKEAKRVGAQRIAVAHHADDRAETVLIRILRGTGPAGLGAMGARTDDVIRPLIHARRSDVLVHLNRHGVPFSEDPSNQDRRFLRSRIRWEVLPLLESISPRVVEHLCSLSEDVEALQLPAAPLGRAQLHALAQAAALGKGSARVSLAAGRVAQVDIATGRIVVRESNDSSGARKPRHSRNQAY
jgi:tRNA(Ile)-lysidine synthase